MFASILSVFHLLRLSSVALPLLSSACPFACLVCSCVFVVFVVVSLSLTDYMQKRKGAKVLPLCPLLSCYVCLDACIVVEKFRCRCFGFFQFVRLVFPTDAARVRRLARSYFDFLGHNVNIAYNRSAFLK